MAVSHHLLPKLIPGRLLSSTIMILKNIPGLGQSLPWVGWDTDTPVSMRGSCVSIDAMPRVPEDEAMKQLGGVAANLLVELRR